MGDGPVGALSVAQRITIVTIPNDPLDRRPYRCCNRKIHFRDEGRQNIRIVLVPFGIPARPQGGLYVWCRLEPGMSATALLERALAVGVAFVAGPAFYPDPAGDSQLRLCFTSVLPPALDAGVRKLAGAIEHMRSSPALTA